MFGWCMSCRNMSTDSVYFRTSIRSFKKHRSFVWIYSQLQIHTMLYVLPGGHWPRKGVWGCAALKTPFSRRSPAARKGPISSKRVSSQDPLLRKFGNFSLNSLNFHPNFSSQAPKFGNFQLTSPQIWKFSAHRPLFSGQMSVRKSGPHTPTCTWKKVECPPWDCTQLSELQKWYLDVVLRVLHHWLFSLLFKKINQSINKSISDKTRQSPTISNTNA